MDQNLLVLLAILPGLLIAGLIWWLDKNRETGRNIIGFFFLGMVITIPAYAFQELSYKIGLDVSEQIWMTFLFAFGVIALTEELMKFVAMRYYLFPKPFFDERMDGIVYGGMLAMGFATLENILYATDLGLETAILRMFTSVPAHGVFGVLMGYYIGKAKFEKTNRMRNLTLAFVVPFLLHGLFDFCILQLNYDLLMGASLLVLLGGLIASGFAIHQFRKGSVVAPAESDVVESEVLDQTTEENSPTGKQDTDPNIVDDPISIQDAFDVETPIDAPAEKTPITNQPPVEEPTPTPKAESQTPPPITKEPTIKPAPKTPEPPAKPIENQDPEAIEKSLADLEAELEEMREDLEDDDEADA